MSDLLIQLAEAVAKYTKTGSQDELWNLIYEYSSNEDGWTPADLFNAGYESAKGLGLI